MSISFVLPVRAGSKRVINKNTRPFLDDNSSLVELKIKQALECNFFEKLYVTTDDPLVEDLVKDLDDDRMVFDLRPDALCQSDTKIEDLISYIRQLVCSDHIFWIHATAPFVGQEVYSLAYDKYRRLVVGGGLFDSLMSVTKIQQFLWSKEKGDLINQHNSSTRWPQTQDLEPYYEINHAFYINSRERYFDRIGKNPYCFELNRIHSIDIDTQDDFEFAKLIYNARAAELKKLD